MQVALTQDVSAADPDCSQSICAGLRAALENAPGVEAVRFESQQQAYERYKQLFAGQPLADVVRPQALPATFRVKLADAEHGAAAVREVVTGKAGVRNVTDQSEVVARLFDFLNGIRNVAFVLALVQALAALLLISNMVQLSAFTRRTEVGVMRLVGATRWSTQLPFLIEAVIAGVVGALIAVLGLVAGKFLFFDQLLAASWPTGSCRRSSGRHRLGVADPGR